MKKNEIKPLRTDRDYKAALADVERLWGKKLGTPEGDRLDVLATLIEAYEECMIRWTRLIRSKPSSFEWSSKGSLARTWRP